MFLTPSSSASANAGKLSVTKLIHNICIGKSGVSSSTCPIPVIFAINPAPTIDRSITIISPIFDDNRYCIDLTILSYIRLPSSTAFTIVAKLSSVIIKSAASFDTSVPVIPIAQPISAFLSAGASFTPSPVIATICPLF